jgi:hypothetical protein
MQNAGNQAALSAKNFDVTRLQGKLQNITQLGATQKQAEVTFNKSTAALNAAMSDGYSDTSGVIDAMMGLLGKSTTEAKNLHTIRSKVRRGGKDTSSPPAAA